MLTLRKDRTLGVEPHPNVRTVREPWSKRGAQVEFEATTPKADLYLGSEVLPIEYAGASLTVAKRSAPMKLAAGEPLRLNVFVDHSVVEIFANGRVAMALRVYPAKTGPVRLDAPGAKVTGYQIPSTVEYA